MRKKKRFGSKIRLIFGAGGILLLIILVSVFNQEKGVAHTNNVDAQISLHSKREAPKTAVLVNPEFASLAFPAKESESLIPEQLAAVGRVVISWFESPGEKEEEHGSWIWTPTMQMSPEYIESILSRSKKEGVNVIYLSIDSYLDIFTMEKGLERERQKQLFTDKIRYFIKSANQKGIEVDAEAGWQNWAEAGNEYKGLAIVNFVKNFNDSEEEKFRGFQYDVEPYLLEEYKEDPAPVLKRFATLVDKTEKFIGESDLRFSVVVPDFFDEKDKMTPKFSYAGRRASIFKHLLNILERRENSSIIIMSYRNFAEGKDGSIEVTENEMKTAKKGRYSTQIIVAQEVGDVPPPYITFHNTSKTHLEQEVAKIQSAFSPSANFGGLAIHYINAYLDLR